jgi:hypothetical protein
VPWAWPPRVRPAVAVSVSSGTTRGAYSRPPRDPAACPRLPRCPRLPFCPAPIGPSTAAPLCKRRRMGYPGSAGFPAGDADWKVGATKGHGPDNRSTAPRALTERAERAGFCSLVALPDAVSRRGVGGHLAERLDTALTVTAPKQALSSRRSAASWKRCLIRRSGVIPRWAFDRAVSVRTWFWLVFCTVRVSALGCTPMRGGATGKEIGRREEIPVGGRTLNYS